MAETTTRLAPSPTGALHLGNARTFLVNYLLARQRGWRVLMRIEDLDGPRVRAGSAGQLLDELAWLGLEWQGPVVYQSARAGAYEAALARLVELGQAYPCTCSRKDVELAASAPHEGELPTYPGTCRGRYASGEAAAATGRPVAWRLRAPDAPVAFDDRFAGPQCFDLARAGGDFVIFKADAQAAYQLAVTIDDAKAGVDAIVRGDDLLDSAARQIHLRRLLGLTPEPAYWHLPLVVGPDGRRLAKRHGDTRVARYRSHGAGGAGGAGPQRVLGLLGFWCGAIETRRPCDMAELTARFDVARLPRHRIVFTEADHAFLEGSC